jgi:hypothetical protein
MSFPIFYLLYLLKKRKSSFSVLFQRRNIFHKRYFKKGIFKKNIPFLKNIFKQIHLMLFLHIK